MFSGPRQKYKEQWPSLFELCSIFAFFKGCHLYGFFFIYWAYATTLKCKANVQSTNASHTWVDIVYTNHKRKGRYLTEIFALFLMNLDLFVWTKFSSPFFASLATAVRFSTVEAKFLVINRVQRSKRHVGWETTLGSFHIISSFLLYCYRIMLSMK